MVIAMVNDSIKNKMANNEQSIDLDTVLKTVYNFSKATNVGCSYLDIPNEEIMRHPTMEDVRCTLCEKMRTLTKCDHNCVNVKLYGSYQAERFGGKYIFFCPLGLVNFASPVVIGGVMRASLLGGPVLMMEPDDYLKEDIFEKFHIAPEHYDEIREIIKDFPVVSPERVSALSELLFAAAAHISDLEYLEQIDRQRAVDVHRGISDYIHYLKNLQQDEKEKENYPVEKEKELINCISQGDKAGASKLLNEILGYIFFSCAMQLDIVKTRVLELIVLLSRAAMEGGADAEQIFGLNFKYINEINDFESVEELSAWLSKIMIRFTDCVFSFSDIKHVDVIYKAIDYMRRNYMRKITLEEVAAHVYLSPSYFSKIFKDETKCNFNTYLNKIRIESSKNLLLNDKINLVDISNMVGFEDQSYYSKVFKKLLGITPGKYRETRGLSFGPGTAN